MHQFILIADPILFMQKFKVFGANFFYYELLMIIECNLKDIFLDYILWLPFRYKVQHYIVC